MLISEMVCPVFIDVNIDHSILGIKPHYGASPIQSFVLDGPRRVQYRKSRIDVSDLLVRSKQHLSKPILSISLLINFIALVVSKIRILDLFQYNT